MKFQNYVPGKLQTLNTKAYAVADSYAPRGESSSFVFNAIAVKYGH